MEDVPCDRLPNVLEQLGARLPPQIRFLTQPRNHAAAHRSMPLSNHPQVESCPWHCQVNWGMIKHFPVKTQRAFGHRDINSTVKLSPFVDEEISMLRICAS